MRTFKKKKRVAGQRSGELTFLLIARPDIFLLRNSHQYRLLGREVGESTENSLGSVHIGPSVNTPVLIVLHRPSIRKSSNGTEGPSQEEGGGEPATRTLF